VMCKLRRSLPLLGLGKSQAYVPLSILSTFSRTDQRFECYITTDDNQTKAG